MAVLEEIYSAHSAELDLLNARISRQLVSSNSLLSKIVASLLRTKGKQLRPLLLMMCAGMFGPVDEKVVAAAAAVELLHNASLIHDDVVDNSMTRRNRPTVNAVWDNHVAVLVGDFFTSSAMQEAISTGDIRIIEALCKLGRHLSMGEIDQIYNAREHSLTEEGYYRIIDYKTASLFVASAEMGCLAAGVDDSRLSILSDYARLFGRCFQIRDDIFDYFPSVLVGKPTGNDLLEGKITLPLLKVLNATRGTAAHDEVTALLSKDELGAEEVAFIQAFARNNGGIDSAYEAMHQLRNRAVESLHRLPESQVRNELEALFDFIISRKY